MPERFPHLSSDTDPLTASALAGLGAFKIATWEGRGPLLRLRARLGTGGPKELRPCVGQDLDWIGMVFSRDRRAVTAWLGKQAKPSRSPALEYRVEVEPGRVIWIRHWVKPVVVRRSSGVSAQNAALVGLVQVIEDQKQLEAASLRALEGERLALGQELHDHTCQILSGLACLTQAFTNSHRQPPAAELKALLSELHQQLSLGLDRVRTRAHSLVPEAVTERGIGESLRVLAHQTETLYSVKIRLRLPSRLPQHSPLQVVQLHGIAQESVANAIKHGRPTEMRISLRKAGKNQLLEIRDNGRGLPADPRPGIGLHLMRHRAALIGATMTIQNCLPTGACVRVNYSMA